MSKRNNLTPQEVCRISCEYLEAVKLAKGELAMEQTLIIYRKGWFRLRLAGHPGTALPIHYRGHEIQQMAAELLKSKPRRTDDETI